MRGTTIANLVDELAARCSLDGLVGVIAVGGLYGALLGGDHQQAAEAALDLDLERVPEAERASTATHAMRRLGEPDDDRLPVVAGAVVLLLHP